MWSQKYDRVARFGRDIFQICWMNSCFWMYLKMCKLCVNIFIYTSSNFNKRSAIETIMLWTVLTNHDQPDQVIPTRIKCDNLNPSKKYQDQFETIITCLDQSEKY